MLNNNKDKTLNQLLGITQDKAPAYNSYLVKRSMELCNVPISEFEVEDYRILIGQGIGLEYLVPEAIDILSNNLFAEGDYYEGDLLKSVLSIEKSFWVENPLLEDELRQICLEKFNAIETVELSDSIKESLYSSVKTFLAHKQ